MRKCVIGIYKISQVLFGSSYKNYRIDIWRVLYGIYSCRGHYIFSTFVSNQLRPLRFKPVDSRSLLRRHTSNCLTTWWLVLDKRALCYKISAATTDGAKFRWKRWKWDYLSELHPRRRQSRAGPEVKEGTMVIVQGEHWALAWVTKVYPVSVQIRRVQKLYVLPIA